MKLANDAMNDVNFGKMKLAVNRMKVKYMMVRNSGSLTDGEKELRDRICEDNEELGHAYRLKESLVSVYSMGDADIARDHLLGWVSWAPVVLHRDVQRPPGGDQLADLPHQEARQGIQAGREPDSRLLSHRCQRQSGSVRGSEVSAFLPQIVSTQNEREPVSISFYIHGADNPEACYVLARCTVDRYVCNIRGEC